MVTIWHGYFANRPAMQEHSTSAPQLYPKAHLVLLWYSKGHKVVV
jgi:hypothetical protein